MIQVHVACTFCIIHDIYIMSYRLKKLHDSSYFFLKNRVIILQINGESDQPLFIRAGKMQAN
jgi:hypothetical protein